MKKVFLFVLTALISLQVVALPVFASSSVTAIPFDAMDCYSYWFSKGLTTISTDSGTSAINGYHGSGSDKSFCDFNTAKTTLTCTNYHNVTIGLSEQNSLVMQTPAVHGHYRYANGYYDPKSYLYSQFPNEYVYMEFFSTLQALPNKIWIGQYGNGNERKYHGNIEFVHYSYVSGSSPSWFHYVIRFKPLDPYYSIDFESFNDKDLSVVPVTLKPERLLSDVEKVRFGLKTSTGESVDTFKAVTVEKFDELISVIGGLVNDPKLKESVNKLDDKRGQFDDTNDKYQALENSFSDDMNKNIVNIDTSPKLTTNNHFINSMKFVSDLYTKLVINTPFEQILMFTATLGIALVLIGKLRNR